MKNRLSTFFTNFYAFANKLLVWYVMLWVGILVVTTAVGVLAATWTLAKTIFNLIF